MPDVSTATDETEACDPGMERSTPPATFWFVCAAIFALNALTIGGALVVVPGLVASLAAIWAGFAVVAERHPR